MMFDMEVFVYMSVYVYVYAHVHVYVHAFVYVYGCNYKNKYYCISTICDAMLHNA